MPSFQRISTTATLDATLTVAMEVIQSHGDYGLSGYEYEVFWAFAHGCRLCTATCDFHS